MYTKGVKYQHFNEKNIHAVCYFTAEYPLSNCRFHVIIYVRSTIKKSNVTELCKPTKKIDYCF